MRYSSRSRFKFELGSRIELGSQIESVNRNFFGFVPLRFRLKTVRRTRGTARPPYVVGGQDFLNFLIDPYRADFVLTGLGDGVARVVR